MAQADKIGQAMQLFSVLANNTDWGSVDWRRVQKRIDSPREAGAAFTAFLKDGSATPAAEAAPSTLVLIKTATLAGAKPKKAKDCFTGKFWGYRDGDIDGWLPKEQTANADDLVGVYQLQNPKGTTFLEMARATVQAAPGTFTEEIVARLKGRGLTLTLPEVEALVERQEGGDDVGLRTDGYANLAFVEDANSSVSALYFYQNDRRWYTHVNRLGRDGRWSAGDRLLLRNSDTLVL